ncbi:unnamed protein product [Penicillium olsonii]|nr:unnamed protein product [Penicillium olsonii]
MDSIAASALIEHFGLEVFTRAEAAMSANKVTKQTADTFQAAAVFLELYQIWGALDLQISGRIKFAKYHAVRIAKAIKNGEDPNASNPVPKDEEQKSITAQEVQAFDESLAEQAYRPTQPPTEGLPEEPDHLRRPLAQQSSHDEPLHSFRASSLQWPLTSSTSGIPYIARNAPGSPGRTMDIDQPQPGGLELPSTPGTIGGSSLVPNLPDIPGTSTFGEADASNHLNTFHSFPPPTANSPVTAPDPPFFYGPSSASAHIPHPAALPSRTPPVMRTHGFCAYHKTTPTATLARGPVYLPSTETCPLGALCVGVRGLLHGSERVEELSEIPRCRVIIFLFYQCSNSLFLHEYNCLILISMALILPFVLILIVGLLTLPVRNSISPFPSKCLLHVLVALEFKRRAAS